MMFKGSVLVILFGLFSNISCFFLQQGQCDPNIALQQNFNPANFVSKWYEVARSPDSPNGECTNLDISSTSATNFVFVSEGVHDNFLERSTVSATLAASTARFTINYGPQPSDTLDFWILGTNYQDYAIAYRCETFNSTHRNVYIWQLGRSTTINPVLNNVMNSLITPLELTLNDLVPVDHSPEACFALPTIPPNQPIILPGECDHNISQINNFNAGDFLGTWHEIYSYFSENSRGTCARAQYSAGQDGLVNVVNSQVLDLALQTFSGTASVVDPANARLRVRLEVQPSVFQERDLWIIDTDYQNYAITYSCETVSPTTKRVYSWILSRNRDLSVTTQVAINRVVDSVMDLNFVYYDETARSDNDCFYFPDPDEKRVVEFRGRCDMNIPTVQNFRPADYMGTWYDIQSYPSGFQQGSCMTATYTLRGNVVEVYNTEVVDQSLDTMTGTAVVSENGNAKLEVTFPVAGTNNTVTTNYWVLETDYENFAFVYTCEYNELTDMRRVWSWKLSRFRHLSLASNNAIEAVMASIPVLDQRYYIQRDHSPVGCFYFPEVQPGLPVMFPGHCETTISAVPNFDLNSFQGLWHETEAYPKGDSGDCVNHQLTAGENNVLNLLTSFNIDQFLQTSSNVLQRDAIDNSGRFTITVEGVEIPFLILLIDSNYNDYALAYSCVNINVDYRGVYFWKFSRTQQLSQAGQTAIKDFIESGFLQILQQRYFEAVDQSAFACASLPTIPAGQPIIISGTCDQTIPVVQNFQPGRYIGLWHLVESYPTEFQNGTCNDATYKAQADGSILVYNTQVINQELDTITGVARLATDGIGKLTVNFPGATSDSDYWIIATDYYSYSLVYSCENLPNNYQRVYSWKLSRSRTLADNATTAIAEAMRNIRVLNDRYYYVINNSPSACFYYPVPDGRPVRFRGHCDETVEVVTNFNAVDYMGNWNDIESYPQFFQEGTCPRAEYTLRDGGVDVFNTQVMDQALDTIAGRAELVPSDNNAAKLTVSFPIAGTNETTLSPYWVLSTDYANYALVYSCQNDGPDNRFVSSWKLSRYRTLSQPAQTAINNAIARVDVLRQDYYLDKGHTEEDCFYFPEPKDEPPLFPGRCDNNIQAIPSFNFNEFIGVWNEIETYPKEEASGDCINHEFSSAPGSLTTLQFTSNQVFNSEFLVSNNGQIVQSSADGSGRFTLTMIVDNTTVTFPYWVLATDYSNFALVYSCVNVGSEYRRVHSWKLSRTRTLAPASNTAIDQAMAKVDVLDQRYFKSVAQSDAACFYIPDIGLNEPVTFTGSCDASVNPIQNFSAGDFAGPWFDIQSYYNNFQGRCVDAMFNFVGGGFDVRRTQVVNQNLESSTHRASLATGNSGRLIVSTGAGTQMEYLILGTDYTNWALVYSCENIGNNRRRVRSWKLSRTRQLRPVDNPAIDAIIAGNDVLHERFFSLRDHSAAGCFYYPIPDGNPVQFRTRCDPNIEVVERFDVARYLGTWYDIQSYPQFFQNGQCVSAEYSDGGNGVVNVRNSQVVDQLLDVWNGTAVLASTDGSAKLNVTFVVAGMPVTSPYWVLDTDYNTYSLVYSCTELNNEYSAVFAWKLSKSRQLSADANAAIDRVIDTIPVLRQDFFVPVGHSTKDCFFFPDNYGGPVVLEGQCPLSSQVDAVPNFDFNLFSGTWHEISRFPSELQNNECASLQFSDIVQNRFTVTQNTVSNEALVTVAGTGSLSNDNRGIIAAVFGTGADATTVNVYVLDTDYSEFALAYSCRNINGNEKQIYSWVLSRNRSGLSQVAIDRIDEAVSKTADLHPKYYEPTAQDNDACFYYPEFGPNPTEIVLPGYCPTNIRGIPNFNANEYLGRWFEISRYPQVDQFGECSRAEYSSMANGSVNVFNTQVSEQTLFTQSGSAVAASDGSGELSVTFVVNGVTNVADYIVLGTDYANYALVYSCRNLDNGYRQVFSWILSRQRTLSAPSTQAVNNIIARTQGLRQDLYRQTSQTDEACFYLPEPNPDEPVIVRGPCGNVFGVPNFNIQRFLGVWHEIERYPTGEDDGECVRATFSGSGNQMQVVDQAVFGFTAQFYVNTVTATENGMIMRTVEVDGGVGASHVWVLDTDYDNYALLYYCMEINSEYRQVFSAKHSRARSLSASSNQAINQALNRYPVLHQRFYVTVDQSDRACFHYPPATGETVILPGSCDQNIPVAQDFEASEYTGTWYQIERYPQTYESGECTGARYSLNQDTGAITVLNWEVIDGELDTIEGNATVISDDGSAKLLVMLPSRAVEGEYVTMQLYVLTTDYLSYSLAYSCENVGSYYRRLGVWKLSRTRTMTAQGTSAINSYMSSRLELDQRYFIPVTQNEDCQEPSSSYFVRSSIIMLLVCAILQLLK